MRDYGTLAKAAPSWRDDTFRDCAIRACVRLGVLGGAVLPRSRPCPRHATVAQFRQDRSRARRGTTLPCLCPRVVYVPPRAVAAGLAGFHPRMQINFLARHFGLPGSIAFLYLYPVVRSGRAARGIWHFSWGSKTGAAHTRLIPIGPADIFHHLSWPFPSARFGAEKVVIPAPIGAYTRTGGARPVCRGKRLKEAVAREKLSPADGGESPPGNGAYAVGGAARCDAPCTSVFL